MATDTLTLGETLEKKAIFVKQVAGEEDLMFGFGEISQVREGENIIIHKINAHTIPYDDTRSIGDVLDFLLTFHSTTGGQ